MWEEWEVENKYISFQDTNKNIVRKNKHKIRKLNTVTHDKHWNEW